MFRVSDLFVVSDKSLCPRLVIDCRRCNRMRINYSFRHKQNGAGALTRRSNELRVVTQESRKNEREHPLRVLLYGIE